MLFYIGTYGILEIHWESQESLQNEIENIKAGLLFILGPDKESLGIW